MLVALRRDEVEVAGQSDLQWDELAAAGQSDAGGCLAQALLKKA